MKGYHGRLLEVDLSARKMADLPLTEEMAKKYIGGATLAAALVYDRMEKGAEPLAPENPLIFSTGPFTGTPLPMVSRYAVGGHFPPDRFLGGSHQRRPVSFSAERLRVGWPIRERKSRQARLPLSQGRESPRFAMPSISGAKTAIRPRRPSRRN